MVRPSNFARCMLTLLAALVMFTLGCGPKEGPVSSASSGFTVDNEDDTPNPPVAPQGDPPAVQNTPSNPPPRENPPVRNDPPVQPPTRIPGGETPAARRPNLATLTVPEGTATELMEFIHSLREIEFNSQSRQQLIADVTRVLKLQLEAATKIQAAEPTEDQRIEAVQIELAVLTQFNQLGLEEYQEQLKDLVARLSEDKNAELALLGRLLTLRFMADDLESGELEDPQPIVAAAEAILAEPDVEPQALMMIEDVAVSLESTRHFTEAIALYEKLFEIGSASEDRQVIARRSALEQRLQVAREQSGIAELKIEEKLLALMEKKPEAEAQITEAMRTMLTSPDRNIAALETGFGIADVLEQSGRHAMAAELYALLGTSFAEHKDPEIAESAEARSAMGALRMGLPGKPLPIEGEYVNGSPFEWSQYAGKVVLVDFWATWCGPCLAELPNIREVYQKYKGQGFEVIGVNIDQSRAALAEFLAKNDIPWQTVVEPASSEGEMLNANRCGVEGIPFMLLVDKEGNVAKLYTRGAQLEPNVRELLGLPAEPAAAEPEDTSLLESEPSWFIAAVDEEAAPSEEEPGVELDPLPAVKNPYSAPPEASALELAEFLLEMQEKPRTIQGRPGFSEAVVEAADRLIAMPEVKDRYREIAGLAKFWTLHRRASFGDDEADAQLREAADALVDSSLPKIAEEARFLLLEQQALNCEELSDEEIRALLGDLAVFFDGRELAEKHLRIASATVKVINQLESPDDAEKEKEFSAEREKHFAEFGKVFAASKHKALAAYGKKLSKPPAASAPELVGKPLELAGDTADGQKFDWASYRGKVVLVDFWATWCGPCRREMPHVKELYERLNAQGFEVVGISLDKDLEALAEFLEQNPMPWQNLAGESTSDLAEKYGVRGIPTMMAIDRNGNVLGVAHQVAQLVPVIETALKAGAE